MTKLLAFFSSLKLTVVCLSLLMILVFVGTLDQVNLGIYYTVKKYFTSFFVWNFFPGGMLIGIVLFINLIVAHIYRFQFTIKKIGIWITHFGLLLLIFGSAITSYFGVESQLQLDEGQSKNYSEDFIHQELYIVESINSEEDHVLSLSAADLPIDTSINLDGLPFSFLVRECHLSSRIQLTSSTDFSYRYGIGKHLNVIPSPIDRRPDALNYVTAEIEFMTANQLMGVYLLSSFIDRPQKLMVGDRLFWVGIRPKRLYTPYSITLTSFTRETYPGTTIPSRFSSDIVLTDFKTSKSQPHHIYMNHPLRYNGTTYFQASFGKDDRMSVLQVVKNPGWMIPYISCLLMALGLCVHFGISLFRFLRKSYV